jgi:hypothetical protein
MKKEQAAENGTPAQEILLKLYVGTTPTTTKERNSPVMSNQYRHPRPPSTAHVITFPPTRRTARTIACYLRSAGFYSLPPRTWNSAADLVEYLTDELPTRSQLMWLWRAHDSFLAQGAVP